MTSECPCRLCEEYGKCVVQREDEMAAASEKPTPWEDRVLLLAQKVYVNRPIRMFEPETYTYSDAISDAIDIIIAGDNQ